MNPITENIIEQTALELLKIQGWSYIALKDIFRNILIENH